MTKGEACGILSLHANEPQQRLLFRPEPCPGALKIR